MKSFFCLFYFDPFLSSVCFCMLSSLFFSIQAGKF